MLNRSRVAEVLYRLKDLFTGPARKIREQYAKLRQTSRETAESVERDNDRVRKSFSAVVGSLKRVAGPLAIVAGALKAGRATNSLADELDRLGKTAAQLDIDASDLAALEFTADRSGVAIGKVEKALFTLQKRAGEAALGIGAAKVAFQDLGIDAERFNELNATEQFELLANAFSEIEGEERRAALASALFSKQNADVLKVLNQGGDAVNALVDEYKSYRDITREATEEAARFNDAGTNFRNLLRSGFDVFGNYFIQASNRVSEAVGLIEKRVEPLEEQLAAAREELERLTSASSRSNANARAIREATDEVERLTLAIEDQAREQEEAQRQTEELARSREAAERADERYRETVEDLTESFRNQTSSQKRNLDQQTSELRAARAEQVSVEKEFQRLREDVTSVSAGDDLSGLDVQTKALEARRRLAEGDAEGAIKAARQGAELLRDLKDEGDEAGVVLGFLADQLGKVANEAAKQQADTEVLDVAKEAEKFNVITAKLRQIEKEAEAIGQGIGTTTGKAIVATLQAELDAATLRLPQPVVEGLQEFRRGLQREDLKRGERP